MGGKPREYGSENQGGGSRVRAGDWTSRDGGHWSLGYISRGWNEHTCLECVHEIIGAYRYKLEEFGCQRVLKMGWTKIRYFISSALKGQEDDINK